MLGPFPVCFGCSSETTVTATVAKTEYHLTEAHLSTLPVHTYKSKYHDCVRLFYKDDVKAIAMSEYGTDDPKQIHRAKAQMVVQKAGDDYSPDFVQMWSKYRTTTHGLKAAWKRYQDALVSWPDQIGSSLFNDWVIKKNQSAKHEIEQAPLREGRKNQLETALEAKGLVLRNDSALCQQYIDGDGDRNLDEIVSIMENMDFLYKHTQYSQIYERLLDQEYEYCRESGERYNNVDRHEVSEQAQEIAMINYRGDMTIVPSGLLDVLEHIKLERIREKERQERKAQKREQKLAKKAAAKAAVKA